jgi:hypothetical protein
MKTTILIRRFVTARLVIAISVVMWCSSLAYAELWRVCADYLFWSGPGQCLSEADCSTPTQVFCDREYDIYDCDSSAIWHSCNVDTCYSSTPTGRVRQCLSDNYHNCVCRIP